MNIRLQHLMYGLYAFGSILALLLIGAHYAADNAIMINSDPGPLTVGLSSATTDLFGWLVVCSVAVASVIGYFIKKPVVVCLSGLAIAIVMLLFGHSIPSGMFESGKWILVAYAVVYFLTATYRWNIDDGHPKSR